MVERYDSECEICKVFSNVNRLNILACLRRKALTVNAIVKKTGLAQSVVSQHLSMMKLRGLLEGEKKGNFVYYAIKYPEILDALDIMRKVKRKIGRKNGNR